MIYDSLPEVKHLIINLWNWVDPLTLFIKFNLIDAKCLIATRVVSCTKANSNEFHKQLHY